MLPAELILKIFSYLQIEDLSKLLIANRTFSNLCIYHVKTNNYDVRVYHSGYADFTIQINPYYKDRAIITELLSHLDTNNTVLTIYLCSHNCIIAKYKFSDDVGLKLNYRYYNYDKQGQKVFDVDFKIDRIDVSVFYRKIGWGFDGPIGAGERHCHICGRYEWVAGYHDNLIIPSCFKQLHRESIA